MPLTFAGTRARAQRLLEAISREGSWVTILGQFPADNRVLWLIDDETVTLYWRPSLPEPPPPAAMS